MLSLFFVLYKKAIKSFDELIKLILFSFVVIETKKKEIIYLFNCKSPESNAVYIRKKKQEKKL